MSAVRFRPQPPLQINPIKSNVSPLFVFLKMAFQDELNRDVVNIASGCQGWVRISNIFGASASDEAILLAVMSLMAAFVRCMGASLLIRAWRMS